MPKRFVLLFSTLAFYVTLFSQSDFSTNPTQQATAFQQQTASEKIYVHTDRDFYVTGEVIWFKLYLTNSYSRPLLDVSKVAYVEVLNADRKPVLQAKIDVQNGTGNGSFMLPVSLNSGAYIFRAYTNGMKNIEPGYFFQKPISIINTLKLPDWQAAEVPAKYDVRFFPEGGNLVYGLQSKLAFKVVDQYGKGVSCTGVIVTDKKDTVTHFQSFKFGMGRFNFSPVAGINYKAIVQLDNGMKISKNLPPVLTQGYVMTTSGLDSERIKVSIAGANVPDQTLYLLVYADEKKHEVLKKSFRSGKAEFILNRNSVQEGVSTITLFNEDQQPLSERLYFKRPDKELQIGVKSDQAQYKTRSNVTVDVTAFTNGIKPAMSDLSVSVFLIDSLQTTSNNIQSYFWLTSALNGFIESPDYYFTAAAKEQTEALENLLLTQGWRRFQPDAAAQNKKNAISFLPEYEGQIVSGKVADKRTGAAASGIRTYLSVPGNRFRFASTTSDENGLVRFVLNDNYGDEGLIIQTMDSSHRVEIDNPFSEQYDTTTTPQFSVPEHFKNALAARSINTQAQNIFFKEQQQQFYIPGLNDTSAFYGVPDKRYLLDDYTRFTTMEEVMREYVTEVRARKNGDQFHYTVRNIPYQTFFEKDPLILLDGVPVLNTNRLMEFDPLKVRKLEIVARKYFLDDLVCDGIVSFTTYDHDLGGFEFGPNATVLDYSGLQLKREFYTPVYQTTEETESRLPDFRDLLFWSPSVKTNSSGHVKLSFYTSDLTGKYAVVIQGRDADGTPGSTVAAFNVEK